MSTAFNQTWDLESIFPGGSTSAQFAEFLDDFAAKVEHLQMRIEAIDQQRTIEDWVCDLTEIDDVSKRLEQAFAFVSCLQSQDVQDQEAKLKSGRVSQFLAKFISAMTIFEKKLLQIPADRWQQLIEDKRVAPIHFPLAELRRRAGEKLDTDKEILIADLSVDGYHAWSEMYETLIGRTTIPFTENGETKRLSVGQAENQMSDGNRAVRQQVFANWEETWTEQEDLFAETINHLAGYRLNVYRHRSWDSVLREPLDLNRMRRETLDAMWQVIEQNKAPFVKFLRRKAELLGVAQLSWHDVAAPLGATTRTFTYEEAQTFIVEHFARFNPEMAEFAKMCFAKRWIEAENRSGKRPGGFCTRLPLSGETRIFMTFSGTADNVSTLAHEIGHAYHQYVVEDLPYMVQEYPMNLAETASTFAEMIVADAALQKAADREEKIVLLEDKVARSVTMFMNIHARFLFETRFYAQRKKGIVSVGELNHLMEAAQREAYQDALGEYHPHFWASKSHFYATGMPFYNFPYTFGYLFSTGIYARALAEGSSFAPKYTALLRDTGRMTAEALAKQHLNVDLAQPDFWQSAISLAVHEATTFLQLTEQPSM